MREIALIGFERFSTQIFEGAPTVTAGEPALRNPLVSAVRCRSYCRNDRERRDSNGRLALDLKDVTVVSLEAVRALTVAEASGIELRNCPAYVREWISRVKEPGLPE